MHPGREIGVGIDLIWQYCESDIPGAGASNQSMPVGNSQMVKIFILAILAFALCSCADFKGFHLKPAATMTTITSVTFLAQEIRRRGFAPRDHLGFPRKPMCARRSKSR